MSSDTPEPRDPNKIDPSPQDQARFSRAKSEPPILDLEAEKTEPSKKPDAAANADTPNRDTIRIPKKVPPRLPTGSILSGMIGGGIVALGVLGYANLHNSTAQRLTAIETLISEKPDRTALTALDQRITQIETALNETNAALAAASKNSGKPDAELMQRIAALEAAVQSVNQSTKTTTVQTGVIPDQRAVRLALILSLRENLRNNATPAAHIAALEKTSETSAAFLTLKANLASPLVPYDDIRSEIIARIKSASSSHETSTEQQEQTSRFSSFFSQLVTVRSASTVNPKISATDVSFAPLLDAIDQEDAKAALAALSALPEAEHVQFRKAEAALQQRSAVESALEALLNTTLEDIAKGDTP